MNKRHSSFSTL